MMDIDSDLTMTGTITSIPMKYASGWWIIVCNNNILTTIIQNKSLCTEVMKCNIKILEQLYDAHRKFDKSNPVCKCKHTFKIF